MNKNIIKTLLFICLMLTVWSCQKQDVLKEASRGDIISVVDKSEMNRSTISGFLLKELGSDSTVKHDVRYYTIDYRSIFKGKPIDTRGILFIPLGVDSPRLITYCHGTYAPLPIFGEPPSYYTGTDRSHDRETVHMGLGFSSAGYAVFMPDYIGYGITADEEHPYMYFPEMFESNIDGIKAAQALMRELGYAPDSRLLLTGWSEGAGAAFSAHRYIQEQYSSEFTVEASSMLAGPYNVGGFVDNVLSKRDEKNRIAPILSWVIYSFNMYGLHRTTDQIWSYPVFDQMSAVEVPSTIPSEIFNGYFLTKVLEKSDPEMVALLDRLSLHRGWKPEGKVFLHHGEEDTTVPYFNSRDAHEFLTAEGADVTLYTYPDGTHNNKLKEYVLTTIHDFNQLR